MAIHILYVLSSLSGLAVLYVTYCIIDFILFHCVPPTCPLDAYKRDRPDQAWALVTGASAGIGLGIASELSGLGFGVLLLGHLEDELALAKRELEGSIPGATIRILVMDACTASSEDMVAMVQSIVKLEITILVNNVGGSPITPPPLRELSTYTTADVDKAIDLNARFMARLTTLLLPILSRKPSRPGRRSLIINTSSGSWIGLPWLTLYSATKAFNRSFSHSLARELEQSVESQHVDCLALVPGDVVSQSNVCGVEKGAPNAAQYGKWVVRTVDGAVKRRMRDLVPYWKHDLQYRILGWLDDHTLTREVAKVVRKKKVAWEVYFQKVN